jgi:hypothetical protein
MIPEYKLYHGAVLAEIIHRHVGQVAIRDLHEEGRPSSYVLDGKVGMQIKHATQRLHPWPFVFTKANVGDLLALRSSVPVVFSVFVCHTDGMACISLDELLQVLTPGESDQAWVRLDRRKGKWYRVSGSGGDLESKKPNGVDAIIEALSP